MIKRIDKMKTIKAKAVFTNNDSKQYIDISDIANKSTIKETFEQTGIELSLAAQGIKEISKEYAQLYALKRLGFSCHEAAEFIFALKSFEQEKNINKYNINDI